MPVDLPVVYGAVDEDKALAAVPKGRVNCLLVLLNKLCQVADSNYVCRRLVEANDEH